MITTDNHTDTLNRQIAAMRPTNAFIGLAWSALGLGAIAFLIGLFNADMQLNEKGYYLITLLFGLYSAVAVQKAVRDREEGLESSAMFFGLSWVAFGSAVILLAVGLWNADLLLSEKGFYAMAYALALFGSIAVQKNTRDMVLVNEYAQPVFPAETVDEAE